MDVYKKLVIILGVVCVLLIGAVIGLVSWCVRDAADSRDIAVKAERMESLVIELGDIVGEERGIRLAAEERVTNLERNLRAAIDAALDADIRASELAIRYREVEAGLGELGIDISTAGSNLSIVTDDIERIIRDAEAANP